MRFLKYITAIIFTITLFGCAKNELTDLTLPYNPYINNEGLPGAIISNAYVANTGSVTKPYKTVIEYQINPDILLIPDLDYQVIIYKNGNVLGSVNQNTKKWIDLKVSQGVSYHYNVQLVYSEENTTTQSETSTLNIPN